MPAEKLYTAREAATDFFQGKIGEPAIRKFIKSGELRSIPVGVRRYVPESELEAFVKRQISAAK